MSDYIPGCDIVTNFSSMLLHLLHCILFRSSRILVYYVQLTLLELLGSSKTYLVYVGHVDIGFLEHIALQSTSLFRTICSLVEQIPLLCFSTLF